MSSFIQRTRSRNFSTSFLMFLIIDFAIFAGLICATFLFSGSVGFVSELYKIVAVICLIKIFMNSYAFFGIYRKMRIIESFALIKANQKSIKSSKDIAGYLLISNMPFIQSVETIIHNAEESFKNEYYNSILKREAELKALQSQINPHFLYNTLDSIRGQAVVEGVPNIANTVEALATMFRYSISKKGYWVTLEEDLKAVENYMQIQQQCFKNKFIFKIEIENNNSNLLEYKVPRLTLQPIVENAIYHGLEMKIGKGRIIIRISETQSRLIIKVSDDGLGIEEQKLREINQIIQNSKSDRTNISKYGIALGNVNERIRLSFGEDYGIILYSTLNIGTDVEIIIPKLVYNPKDEK